MSRLLDVNAIESGYGRSRVLFGVTLHVDDGESVALVGRNGMGKTTTIRTILGLCRATAGRVTFAGDDVTHRAPYRIARHGIGIVPEGRQVFPALTVRENLIATAANYGGAASPWTVRDVFDLFPRLAERAAALGIQLSGGEQQMLAIGRALMLNPRLMILDEATEGLAPIVRDEIWSVLRRLRERGQSVLVVDKHLPALAKLCDRAIVLEKGRTVWTGAPAVLAADTGLHDRYLSV
ncbi:MAG: transporter ATP-binding protein [Candidatus Eremiobacteraeota bacterium]|nr:transporter ATP-binding protein [Candidatus Eremiobacteraeota bacterium]